MRVNFYLKGTRFNPYREDEFPRHHIHKVTSEEMKRLECIWKQHPEIWRDRQQPDWDKLFDLAEL